MGFSFSIKKDRAVNERRNKAIVKFCQSKFENHISIKSFSLLSTDAFIMLVSRRLKKNISDNYNAISVGRFSSTKFGKDSWYFNNSLFCKLLFSLVTNDLLSSLKKNKRITPEQVIGGNTLNLA